MHIYAYVFAVLAASPAPNTPIHKGRRPSAASTKGAGGLRPPAPFVESLMDGCVGAGKASDAAKSCLIVQESWQLDGTLLNGTLLQGTF